jgi:hypothetical protein
MRNHKYQYYGTQTAYFKNKIVLYPVINIDSINIYRNRLGKLMPFSAYMKLLNVNFDINEYKRMLPELIKAFKVSDTPGLLYLKNKASL